MWAMTQVHLIVLQLNKTDMLEMRTFVQICHNLTFSVADTAWASAGVKALQCTWWGCQVRSVTEETSECSVGLRTYNAQPITVDTSLQGQPQSLNVTEQGALQHPHKTARHKKKKKPHIKKHP